MICSIKVTAGIKGNTSTCKFYTSSGALESSSAGGKCLLAVPLHKGFTFSMLPSIYLPVKWGITWEDGECLLVDGLEDQMT